LFEQLLFLTGFGEDPAGFDCIFGFDFPQRDENLPSGWSVSRVHISDKSRNIACRVATSRPARMSPNNIE
jgi:hypothetical protein